MNKRSEMTSRFRTHDERNALGSAHYVEGVYNVKDLEKFLSVGEKMSVKVTVVACEGEVYVTGSGSLWNVKAGGVLLRIENRSNERDLTAFWRKLETEVSNSI